MYRSLLFRWLPIRRIPKECVAQVLEVRKCAAVELQTRYWSLSVVCSKKRRSVEEKAAESHGRRVIRYSPKASSEVVGIWRDMTVQDIADVLGKDVDHVLRALEFADKTEAEYSAQSVVRSAQVVRDVVKICGHRFRAVPRPDQQEHEEENKDAVPAPPAPAAALRPRPPVVCVMGHVDHGKTTLLDALRNTAVVDTEFGGITQHIGAFEVRLSSGDTVTFLDTPGHAAFCAMRARGARATDLVVLVVAADDGAREQTLESVRMAREAGVPILVAINKIDKPAANIERALQSLSAHGVVCESLGGDTQAVAVSALKRQGLDALVEALWLQARLRDLRADPDSLVEGVVLEAQLDAKDGRQATVLVQRGTLRCGAVLVAGEGWAKVRALRASDGRALSAAPPACAARVAGWRALPAAGDTVIQVHSEKRAGEVMRWRRAQRMKDKQAADEEASSARAADHRAEYRAALARRRALGRMRVRPDGPRQKMIQEDHFPTLRIIVKGDVDGSVEAILGLLDTYEEHHVVRLDIVHFAVGAVTPGDLEIAEAFNAVIYAFNVTVPEAVLAEARQRRLAVREHNVIYRLVNDVREQINERIPPTQEEEILGEANVLQQFLVSEGKRKVPVAGCRCVRGALARNAQYRLVREQQVVFEGKLSSMKHLKDEVQSIKRDMECGLRFTEHVEARPGDTVLCFRRVDRSHTTAWDPGC